MGTARKAFGRISELLNGSASGLHLPDAPSGCPKRSEGGSPATARRKCVRCTPYKRRPGGASERPKRRQPPPPPVRYTGIARPSPALTEPGASVLPTEAEGRCPPPWHRRRASGASVTKQAWRSQQKIEKATAPSPSSSLCRYRAHKPCTY